MSSIAALNDLSEGARNLVILAGVVVGGYLIYRLARALPSAEDSLEFARTFPTPISATVDFLTDPPSSEDFTIPDWLKGSDGEAPSQRRRKEIRTGN